MSKSIKGSIPVVIKISEFESRRCSRDCPFLAYDENGLAYCTIYEHRPNICRLFGKGGHPFLTCPNNVGYEEGENKMNDRLLFRIPIFYNDKFLGFEYHNIETGQVLTDIKDKTDCENWKFGDWEQCTGLKDKNGNLIYESDYVKANDVIYRVFWNKTKISLASILNGDIIDVPETITMEIVGNEHEKDSISEIPKNTERRFN